MKKCNIVKVSKSVINLFKWSKTVYEPCISVLFCIFIKTPKRTARVRLPGSRALARPRAPTGQPLKTPRGRTTGGGRDNKTISHAC